MAEQAVGFDFGFTGEEYKPISEGFANTGYIGLLDCVRRWDIGFSDGNRLEPDGKTIPQGRVYRAFAERDEAEAYALTIGNTNKDGDKGIAIPVLLMTMSVASVTNMDDERRKNMKVSVLQSSARLVGLGKDYRNSQYGPGLNLVTIPSVVDAFARFTGLYAEPLFDVNISVKGRNFSNLNEDADSIDFVEALVVQRQAIWKALGEEDKLWRNNRSDKATSSNMQQALTLLEKSWKRFARFHILQDPSPKAFYDKRDGGTDRNRVPAVSQFFANERAAVEAGQAELGAAVDTHASNGNVVPFSALSALARESYTETDWPDIERSIRGDVAKSVPLPKIAKSYGLELRDVKLFA